MPDLRRTLREHEPDELALIAELAGLEPDETPTGRDLSERLARHLLQRETLATLIAPLPPEARAALSHLIQDKQPIAHFTRQHGVVRKMGAARRERERPWQNDPSPAETLWYRGLLATAFLDAGRGPEEFAFLPDDLRPLLPPDLIPPAEPPMPGAPAEPPADFTPTAVRGFVVDDLTTLLAYLQTHTARLEANHTLPDAHRAALQPHLRHPSSLDWLLHLTTHLRLIEGVPLRPIAATTRPFLEAARAQQIQNLAIAWRDAPEWNDLKHLPGLRFEGAWHNDPLAPRLAVGRWLARVPLLQWWSLETFVTAIYQHQPDFQRRAGDYEAWYIRDAQTGDYLRGFAHWARVEGALIRWLIQCPFNWLGLVEVNRDASAFRLTPFGAAYADQQPWPNSEPAAPLWASADGLVRAPLRASPYVRFQLARIAHWLPLETDHYAYRLTPASLEQAKQRGIAPARLIEFMQEAVGPDLPPALLGALQHWERYGPEATLVDVMVLKIQTADLLDTLCATPSVYPLLGERFGPTLVAIPRANVEALRNALVELGVLLDELNP